MALDEVVAVVYPEMRRIAEGHLRRDQDRYALSPTALVHEAYLRLLDAEPSEAENRVHFCRVVSRGRRRLGVRGQTDRRTIRRDAEKAGTTRRPELRSRRRLVGESGRGGHALVIILDANILPYAYDASSCDIAYAAISMCSARPAAQRTIEDARGKATPPPASGKAQFNSRSSSRLTASKSLTIARLIPVPPAQRR